MRCDREEGWFGIAGVIVCDWQSEHPLVYLVTVSFIPGHQ